MAVRYFCDNCGAEAEAGMLEVVVIAIPPQSETFDVCPACVQQFRADLERCGRIKRDRALAPPATLQRRALVGYRAVAQTPGAAVVARSLSYVGVFVAFFALVTLLTSLR